MDFILPASLPACGIPWEKVLPPLLPRLNRMYGDQCGWNQFVTPDTYCSTSSAQVECDNRGFIVQVDVKLFRPEDLLVKVTGDFVEVQGRHEEKKRDGPGVITRQFNRRYRIPEGVDSLALESAVSPEGILVISAPLLQDKDRTSPTPSTSTASPTPSTSTASPTPPASPTPDPDHTRSSAAY